MNVEHSVFDDELTQCVADIRQALVNLEIRRRQAEQECFVANWLMQNPTLSVSDYTMCHSTDWSNGVTKFWIGKTNEQV